MRKHFFLVILGTLSSLCPCAADFIVHNGGACVFQFGWTYYGGQGLDLNCHPEITTSSCCATLGPGQEAPFPRGVVCPADGFSITPFGGQPTEEFTVAKYGADFTIVYNCGIAQVKDPSVNDDDDDDDCKNQSDDNTCADCSAMPRWAVSEPYISLWLRDEPMSYKPGLGPPVVLHLSFKQQDQQVGYDPSTFGIGKKWNFSWLSYVTRDVDNNPVVHFGSGGLRVFTNNIEFLGNSQIAGNTTTGYTNTYPDGTTEIYSFMVVTTNGFMKAFLTARANPEGQQTRFYYTKSNDTNSPVIRLKSVVDGDGLTNIISYVASNPYSTNLISQVTDPFNRTVTFLYDTTGHLTNITDVGGISSSFVYDNNDWVTNLTTPYGATSFKISDVRQSPSTRVPNGRVIQITESDGGKELYLFTNNAPGLATNYSQIPSLSPYTGTTLDNTSMDVNNSFHWNKLQYANLSSSFQMSGNVSQLTSNDFFRGRMRHWLRTGSGTNSVSQILSMQREASPNGTTEGQKTWYDYAGKTNTEYIGTQSEALFVARFLPNGNTNFTRILRNGCVTVE